MEWQINLSSSSKADKFKRPKGQAQKQLQEMKDKWWAEKAEEVRAEVRRFSQLQAVLRCPEDCLWTIKVRIHPLAVSRRINTD